MSSSPSALGGASSVRKTGRPRKYDWSDKRDICYKLYIEENKSSPEVAQWFANHFGVDQSQLPGNRDFLRQFRRWGFPEKREKLTAERHAALVERLRELWEQNLSQKAIGDTVRSEGWPLEDRAIHRLRQEHGLLLRVSHGFAPLETRKKRSVVWTGGSNGSGKVIDARVAAQSALDAEADHLRASLQTPNDGLTAAQAEQRARRLQEIQLESDSRLVNGKRRRRIRGYSHLPPDEPGLPPRYKSETSLDECKAYLYINNEQYQEIRKQFTGICVEHSIIKKTQCEPGVWDAAKDRLIRENMHLSAVFNPLLGDLEQKGIALEVICADVTKRMRVDERKLSVRDANVGLGLNPIASKDLRCTFYNILVADHFESRLLCGDERFEQLKAQWYAGSEFLQDIIAEGAADKLRMLNVLTRDAMKRYQDDKKKSGDAVPARKDTGYGPGPGPVKSNTARAKGQGKPGKGKRKLADQILDPALQAVEPPQQPVAAYFRLSPASQIIGNHPKVWLGKMSAPTIAELHRAAASNAGAAMVARVQGIVKNADGSEDSYQIDEEMELQAYIAAAEAGGKATFVVVLEGGYA